MDATWHSEPRGSATQAHATYIYIFIFIFYIVYSYNIQPSIYRKGIQPTNPSDLINPTGFINFSLVGLIHTVF